jgi:D-alanyl-D-alanine carboxypeptidase
MRLSIAIRKVRRSVVVALAVGIVCLASAADAASPKTASLVMDARTGRILHARNADSQRYPASLTKIMTLYMVFDALERKRLKLNTRMRVSARAAAQPPSELGLKVGQTITVKDAILALVTKSANDVATVIAEHLGGTESEFSVMMTAKARKLGMSRTTFRNASGLPNPGQLSTARDMAMLARAVLYRFPGYYHYFSTRSFTYRGANHRNHNGLLGTYDGVDGIKTGYIRASGFNLVASAKRGDQRLIGVVFGGKSSKKRNTKMVNLLNDGFRKNAVILASARKAGAKEIGYPPPKPVIGFAPRLADTGSNWGIQVGAFRNQQVARDAAHTAISKALNPADNGEVQIVRYINKDRKRYYLAQIHNLNEQKARHACKTLRESGTDCFQLRFRQSSNTTAVRDEPKIIGLSTLPTPTAKPNGKWGVQVGAYPHEKSAYKVAKKAVATAPSALEEGYVKVVPLKRKRHGLLYRGRVLGISKQQAYAACQRLATKNIACMVLRNNDAV